MKTLKLTISIALVLALINCKKEEPTTPTTTRSRSSAADEWVYYECVQVVRDVNTDTIIQPNGITPLSSTFGFYTHKLDGGKYYQALVGTTTFTEVGYYTTDSLFYGTGGIGTLKYGMKLNSSNQLVLKRRLSTGRYAYHTERITMNKK